MQDRRIKIHIENHRVYLKNTSSEDFKNCFLDVKSSFYNTLLLDHFDLSAFKSMVFDMYPNNFFTEFEKEPIRVKFYSDHKLVYQKDFFDKSKCYILLSNDRFEKLTEQVIEGLNRYSNIDILHYTINYDSNLTYDNLINIRKDVAANTNDGQFMQFMKPIIFLDVLDRGFKNACFLDSDIQVRSNIDSVFDKITGIESGPILHKGAWDYTIANGNYVPGPLLSNFMDLPTQKYPQGVTNIMLFSEKHKDLFSEWKDWCLNDTIESIRKEEFLHDELILNCLMWKKNAKPKFFFFALNVLKLDDVEFFYDYENLNYEDGLDMNKFSKGHAFQSFIPYDKNEVVAFHCVKDPEEAKKINDLILKKENKIKITMYDNIKKVKSVINKSAMNLDINFIDGPFVQINGHQDKKFKVYFINKTHNHIEHFAEVTGNSWVRASKKYFVDWKIKVEGEDSVFEYDLDFSEKTVYIALDSKSLGDTLAWFPYVEEFGKKHNCNLICSTFWNHLFEDQYPNIKFIKPGEVAHNIFAMYTIGWFYLENQDVWDSYKNPKDFKNQPLQKTASDILGLNFEEVVPRIKKQPSIKRENIVSIAIHSTAQAKYWNNPEGWQKLVDELKSRGYEVVVLSQEPDGYMGNSNPKGAKKLSVGPIEGVIETLQRSKLFIGIGSGLSWLSWATETPTVIISGFSKSYTETTKNTIRISSSLNMCNGCFNTHRLDPSDWNWCPVHKGTDRQFECSKNITADEVIKAIEHLL